MNDTRDRRTGPRNPPGGGPGPAASWFWGGLIALSLAGCAKPAQDLPPNVLLIIVDTLRSDRLGCYGGMRNTSPAVDALAADGVRFDRAYAASPWTLPSMASILTGLYPASHGARTKRHRLPLAAVTLAEALSVHGYATAAVVSHLFVGSEYRFDQGYDIFLEDHARGHAYVSTQGVTSDALRVLNEFAADSRPFFLTVHYFDPHSDYQPHDEVPFAPPGAGRLTGGESIEEIRRLRDDITPEEREFLLAVYDEEIRHTDAGIARLLRGLDVAGLTDRTLVVFTADHGEEFFEHGVIGHGRSLRETVIRVPLVFRGPGVVGGRTIVHPASHASVTPTVLDLLGLDAPDVARQAGSLAAVLSGGDADSTSWPWPLCESDFVQRRPLRAIVGTRFKLVFDQAEAIVTLRDLELDPTESRSWTEERQTDAIAWFDELRARHDSLRTQLLTEERETELSPENVERLRALGYAD